MEPAACNHRQLIVNGRLEGFYVSDAIRSLHLWMDTLITNQDMKVMMGPHAFYLKRPGLRGWTVLTGIETSHCALHTWQDEAPYVDFKFDLYTCGTLYLDRIREAFAIFGVIEWHEKVFDRADNLMEIGGVRVIPFEGS